MDKPSFEEALARLEETVRRLEAGNLPLEEALALFEEGTRLARSCSESLEAADLKIRQLIQTPGGAYFEKALDLGDDGAGEDNRSESDS